VTGVEVSLLRGQAYVDREWLELEYWAIGGMAAPL
jgi:hypothetical protein